jgi:serine phosphatase RsbU (regulator of sigma subunit)
VLARRGPALGILPDAQFAGQYLTMARGAVLCAYTDGLTDRHNAPTPSDARRLPHAAARALQRLSADCPYQLPDAQELAERIVREVLGGDAPDDDVCLAVLCAT